MRIDLTYTIVKKIFLRTKARVFSLHTLRFYLIMRRLIGQISWLVIDGGLLILRGSIFAPFAYVSRFGCSLGSFPLILARFHEIIMGFIPFH